MSSGKEADLQQQISDLRTEMAGAIGAILAVGPNHFERHATHLDLGEICSSRIA